MDKLYGYIFVCGSILMFGSFAAPIGSINKNKKISVHPMIKQFYQSLAVGISCQLLNIFCDFNYDYYVLIASVLYISVNILVQYIISLIGISISISIIGSTTIIVAFLSGIILFPTQNYVSNIAFNVISLILLTFGIILTGLSKIISLENQNGKWKITYEESDNKNLNLPESKTEQDKFEESNNKNLNLPESKTEQDKFKNKKKIIGILLAAIAGILNGCSMAPIQYAALIKKKDLITFISFYGIGIFLLSNIINIIFIIIYFLINRKFPNYYFKKIFLKLFSSGIIWNIGFVCSVFATNILGLSIAFPLSQLSLIINGFWGIVIFKEIKKKFNIILWIISVIIILIGALLYSLSLN